MTSGVTARLIENWLTNATERSFQIPFCWALQLQGHVVVHLTRHGPMEFGKDILSIATDGMPCAYQLKTADNGRINLTQWRRDVEPQLLSLVGQPINHPSIDSTKGHRSYLVTNGDIDEEVQVAIKGLNQDWAAKGLPYHLNTLVKGEMFQQLTELGEGFWPPTLRQTESFLNLFLRDGSEPLDKTTFCTILEGLLHLTPESKQLPPASASKAIAEAALAAAILTSNSARVQNHFAEIEAWTCFLSHLLAAAQRWNLPNNDWSQMSDLAATIIWMRLGELADEVIERKHWLEGDSLPDYEFVRPRLTLLRGVLSVLVLKHLEMPCMSEEKAQSLRSFCTGNNPPSVLWGEGAIPQFLAVVWLLRRIGQSFQTDQLLAQLIYGIAVANQSDSQVALPNPYWDVQSVLTRKLGLPMRESEHESFSGMSYCLESLVHLAVRRNLRRTLTDEWRSISHIFSCEYVPDAFYQYLLWRNGHEGILNQTQPQPRQSWGELKTNSSEQSGDISPLIRDAGPFIWMLFLIVFPHRSNPRSVRAIDGSLGFRAWS